MYKCFESWGVSSRACLCSMPRSRETLQVAPNPPRTFDAPFTFSTSCFPEFPRQLLLLLSSPSLLRASSTARTHTPTAQLLCSTLRTLEPRRTVDQHAHAPQSLANRLLTSSRLLYRDPVTSSLSVAQHQQS